MYQAFHRSDAFGRFLVDQHYEEIWREHPKFAAHIERTCVFTQRTPTGVIYRILGQEEVLKRSVSSH